MAQNGPITIKNFAASDVILTPAYKEGLVALYTDRTATAGLQTELSLGMRKPKGGQNGKYSIKLSIPYSVVVGDSTANESVTAFVELVVPVTASTATRKDVVAGISSMVNDAIINDLLIANGFPY